MHTCCPASKRVCFKTEDFPPHPLPRLRGHPVTPGISRDEYAARRRAFASLLPTNSVAIIPAYRTRYSSLNILYCVPSQPRHLELICMRRPHVAIPFSKTTICCI